MRRRGFLRTLAGLPALTSGVAARAGAYEDFFRAIELDQGAGLRRLLERGFDPNTLSPHGQTGLFLALQGEAFAAAEVLWNHPGLDIDKANDKGETALMIAALKGQRDWCLKLVERGAAVQREGWSPLHYAATGPEPAIVAMLLDRGAPVDAASPNRSTPLMLAARYGSEAAAQLLLQRGANPARRNDLGLTAADFARSAGREDLARALEAAGR